MHIAAPFAVGARGRSDPSGVRGVGALPVREQPTRPTARRLGAERHEDLHAARLLEWAVLVGVAGEELDERQRRLAHDGGLVRVLVQSSPHAVEPHELGARHRHRLARRA